MYAVEDDDFDDFQDACETYDMPADMTLEKSLQEAQLAIDYFFNNKFDEARGLVTPYANSSLYHSLGNSVFYFLEAVLTFDPHYIGEASNALKLTLSVCNRYRKKNTISESVKSMVGKTNYEQYTEMEAHAEQCYAECLLLKALLTFMEDETLASFIKAGLKIRSCFNSMKDCSQILQEKNWGSSPTKVHFESGVKLGLGAFNLMISMLPGRVIKLLEFIGFSGNKELGLADLQSGFENQGLHQVLCAMVLLGYHLITMYVLSDVHVADGFDICEKILANQSSKYPNGVWFNFFKGRMEFMKCNLDGAIEWYTKAWKSQDKWEQFHHFCYWELTWVNCLKQEWGQAEQFTTYLIEKSKWSRTSYCYQKFAIMLMSCNNKPNDQQKATIEELLKKTIKYKQRVAGKSIPIEKFCVKKAERYLDNPNNLIVPILELMYLWNMFKILKGNQKVAGNILKLIESAEKSLDGGKNKYDTDKKAVLLLLKGACLRQLNSPLQALEALEGVLALQKNIVEDTYTVPFAVVEIGLLEWDQGNTEKAIGAFEDAKKNFARYFLEARLHFRIHTALQELKKE
ncbi:tetratricopeptide repeat protein 39B-like isoform X2 [Onthophagus taurus]